MMGEMGELFRILKEENAKHREKNYDSRIQFAIRLFEQNNISYTLCNENNAHFNLYLGNKVVLSFWAWTGKIYSPNNIIKINEQRGIKNCVALYNKHIRGS